MTTEPETKSSRPNVNSLTETILKGDHVQAASSAEELSRNGGEVNDLIDSISEAMSIVSDLHEISKLSPEEVEGCEKAAEKALEVLRPKIRVEQTRVSGRVMVSSMEGDPHSFDKTLLITMLEIAGFTALDGGSDMRSQELVERAAQTEPDILAVPLVTELAAKNLASSAALLSSEGSRLKIVAYGRRAASVPELGIPVEEGVLGALSRIAELLIRSD